MISINDDNKLDFKDLENEVNLTPLLDDQVLNEIADQVINGYEIDEKSREKWLEINDAISDALKIKLDTKDIPWPNASNMSFPLIQMAAQDCTSNITPNILTTNMGMVKFSVKGKDDDNLKTERANKVVSFMNFQCDEDIKDWRFNTKKLLKLLPIWGLVFKKTYYDPSCDEIKSAVCSATKVCVNQGIQSLDRARRITHLLPPTYTNDIITKQRQGIYNEDIDSDSLKSIMNGQNDDNFEIDLLEQLCYLDLDNDGYKEPYVVTVHKDTRSILRIVNRFKEVKKDKKERIIYIEGDQYFTAFHCIFSSDGGFYSIGYGALLLSVVEAINTLANQIVDAGTLNNSPIGLVNSSCRLSAGDLKFKTGQLNPVNTPLGSSLSQNIMFLPTKEPSAALQNMMQMLIQIGKDLASTTDVMKGKQPAQNVATGTVSLLAEQSGKGYKDITDNVILGLKEEFKKIYELDYKYLKDKKYRDFLDDKEASVKKDFECGSYDLYPAADPTLSSTVQRVTKAQILSQLATVDRREVDKYMLESMQLTPQEIKKLQPDKDPNEPPPIDIQESTAKIGLYKAQTEEIANRIGIDKTNVSLAATKLNQDIVNSQWQNREVGGRIHKSLKDALHNDEKQQTTIAKMTSEQMLKSQNLKHKEYMDKVNASLDAIKLGIDKSKVETGAIVDIHKINTDKAIKENTTKDAKVTKKTNESAGTIDE